MGQYYKIVNLDKGQYLHAHKLGNGLKLMEFGNSGYGMLSALAVLLAHGSGPGTLDFPGEHPLIGSWAGDRIVVTGDYADDGKFLDGLAHYRRRLGSDTIDLIREYLREPERFKTPSGDTEVPEQGILAGILAGMEPAQEINLYHFVSDHFDDISDEIIGAFAACEVSYHPFGNPGFIQQSGWRSEGAAQPPVPREGLPEQHFVIVNPAKGEYLHPHKFGDDDQLMAFGVADCGVMCGLAVVLADGNNRGGGDLRTDDTTWVGRWAGDPIYIAGDLGPLLPNPHETLYYSATHRYADISDDVIEIIVEGEGQWHPLAKMERRVGDIGRRARPED